MEALKKFEVAIETYISPLTFPVAIKLLRSEAGIPKGIERASKVYGHKFNLCQGWAMARHNGESVAMLKDDQICPLGIIVLGLAELPEFYQEGNIFIDRYTASSEAAARIADEMYKFPVGEYVGLVTAPVPTCDFEPDLVLIFCNPLQLLRLIQAAINKEGGRFPNSILPSAACADAIVPAMLDGRCHFSIPCLGDRRYGVTSADEVIFTVPVDRLEEIAIGLKYTQEHGMVLPLHRWIDFEPVPSEVYKELRGML